MEGRKATNVINYTDFKVENVTFTSVRDTSKGGKAIYINYDYEDGFKPKPLRIQMKNVLLPFGISSFNNNAANQKNTGPIKATMETADSIDISLRDVEDMKDKIEALEDLVFEEIKKNRKDLYKGKQFESDDVLFSKLCSCIKQKFEDNGEVDTAYPARLKTKLNKNVDGQYTFKLFNVNKERVPCDIDNYSEVLPKGSICDVILECRGVWIVSDFGISWSPVQMLVYSDLNNNLPDFAFIPDTKHEEKVKTVIDNLEAIALK